MPQNRPEDDIARLKAAIADAKRTKEQLTRLMAEMDKRISKINLDKAKDRARRK